VDGLELRDIGFAAANKHILADVSLSVAPGETLALLGPSGSGKTTLLRLVAGLDRPTSGSIWFDGQEVTRLPAHRRGFGLMFQDHALFPHLDVAGNVAFGLRGQDAATQRARVTELLALVGLAGFGSRRIDKLSGGERQRVALARALAPAPRLLMLDEPLASLDRSLRQRLVAELREILTSLAIPAIYVTHDQFEAFAIAHRVAILDHGQVVRAGAPDDIWRDPRTEFVARFLGMENIIDGVRRPDGMVETADCVFGPIPGAPGPVRLTLAAESATLADRAAPNVLAGTLAASSFHGARTVVTVAAAGEDLEFELPANADLPAPGERVWLRVSRAFVVTDAGSPG
jgi:ABC-type Fe3+/spermidine/putrescine transport system ATPase subunit